MGTVRDNRFGAWIAAPTTWDATEIDAATGRFHAVRLYRSRVAQVESAAAYVARGLARGNSALIIAGQETGDAIEGLLHSPDLDLDDVSRAGRIARLSTSETLTAIASNGEPSWEPFHQIISAQLERMPGPWVVYGEMVDELMTEGKSSLAIRLEGLWNRFLAERQSVSLLCSCALVNFSRPGAIAAFSDVCASHALILDDESGTQSETSHDDRSGRLEAERLFRLMADNAPVLLWMSGTDSNCTFFNSTWLEFTGQAMSDQIGVGWAAGVHPEDLSGCIELYQDAFRRREPFETEYRLRRADGEYRWVLDRGVPRFQANGAFAGFIGSAHDVTESRNAHHALLRSSRALADREEHLRKILEASPDAMITLDAAGNVESLNTAGERMFQCAASEMLGKSIDSWVQDSHRVSQLVGGVDGGDPASSLDDVVCIRSDGTTFPGELWVSQERRVLIIRDCSRQRRLERDVLETGEALKQRIGQDLHDGLGQLLTSVAFMASGLVQDVPAPLRARVERIATMVNSAVQLTQYVSRGLVPPKLHGDITLLERLEDLARTTSDAFSVNCTVAARGDFEEVGSQDAYQLLMIAQEAVTNCIRHAKCLNIKIVLSGQNRRRRLSVQDDGDTRASSKQLLGLGIRSMEYRARLMGGHLTMHAREEGGLEVRCDW